MPRKDAYPAAGAFSAGLSPYWFVALSNGESLSGQPSWLSNGKYGRLPVDAGDGANKPGSDWRRLMARCAEEQLRIERFTLWVGGRPFRAPDHRSGYGYYEIHSAKLQGSFVKHEKVPSGGSVIGIAMCWPEKSEELGLHVKSVHIYANGVYEEWREPKWKPCMIGEWE